MQEDSCVMRFRDANEMIAKTEHELQKLQESLSQLYEPGCGGKFTRYVKLRKYKQDIENMKTQVKKIYVFHVLHSKTIHCQRRQLLKKMKDIDIVIKQEMDRVQLEFDYNIFS